MQSYDYVMNTGIAPNSRAGLIANLNHYCYNPSTFNPQMCAQYATAVGFAYGPEAVPRPNLLAGPSVLAATTASGVGVLPSNVHVPTTTLAAATYTLGGMNTSPTVCSSTAQPL